MKKKILSIILVFTIVLSSSISSFANNKDLVIDYDKANKSAIATVGGYVITKQTFNIIVGVASACGVALLTENDAFDFVQNTINAYVRKYEKVDSGDFTTKKAIENLESEIKNGSSKDPKDPTKLIVNSGLVGLFVSLFDSIKADEESVNIAGSVVPIAPKYYELYKELEVNVPTYVHLVNGDRLYFKLKSSGWYENILESKLNAGAGIGSSNYKEPSLSYVKCGSGSWCGSSCNEVGASNIYHLGVRKPTGSYSSYYKDINDKFVDFYIPTTKFMGSYVPINKDVVADDVDVPISSNPNINIGGEMDIPSDSINKPSNELPSYPSLDDIDFSGFDFSSLGSLFENFKNKFPFSLPFDLHNILSSFSVDPQAPIFEVPLFSESITIDLTQFNELANIIRMFVVIGWVVGLFILTKTFGG